LFHINCSLQNHAHCDGMIRGTCLPLSLKSSLHNVFVRPSHDICVCMNASMCVFCGKGALRETTRNCSQVLPHVITLTTFPCVTKATKNTRQHRHSSKSSNFVVNNASTLNTKPRSLIPPAKPQRHMAKEEDDFIRSRALRNFQTTVHVFRGRKIQRRPMHSTRVKC
jgi:hypothetical protein